jgi:hypothetical protein
VGGDIRIIVARVDGEPLVMLYRYEVTGQGLGGTPRTFSSPLGEENVAEVSELTRARVAFVVQGAAWAVEAAIPWAAVGAAAPAESIDLRGDVGALASDPDGTRTVSRFYWSNREHVVLGDLPAEARILPVHWGTLRFERRGVDVLMDEALDREEGAGVLQELLGE